jgi:hypothetical protein
VLRRHLFQADVLDGGRFVAGCVHSVDPSFPRGVIIAIR